MTYKTTVYRPAYPVEAFDCRKHIKPGDQVEFVSFWSQSTISDFGKDKTMSVTAPCLAVYRDFIIVQLKRVRETVNRDYIKKVNGTEYEFGGYYTNGKKRDIPF